MPNMHQISPNILFKTSFDGALANSTQNGTVVDTLEYRRAAAVINIFTGAATTANFQLQDSPDNSTWTSVSGATLGSAIAASTADTGAYVIDIDLAKRQRYLRVQIIGTGTAGNAVANIALYEPILAGVTQVQTPISV